MTDDFSAYRAIGAVNWSTLKEMARSPLHYQHALMQPRRDTPAMKFGRLVHCAVFEPVALLARYAVIPDGIDRRTKAGKEMWATFADTLGPREAIEREEYERAVYVGEAVRAHPAAGAMLIGGEAEKSIIWTDALTGLVCKARLDWRRIDLFADLKTTSKGIGQREFSAECARRLYHGQIAFYRAGLAAATNGELLPAYLIAAESEPPFDVAAYQLTDDDLYAGEQLVRRLLSKLAACRALGEWPGQAPTVQPLTLPPWALDAEWDELSTDAAASEAALMEEPI